MGRQRERENRFLGPFLISPTLRTKENFQKEKNEVFFGPDCQGTSRCSFLQQKMKLPFEIPTFKKIMLAATVTGSRVSVYTDFFTFSCTQKEEVL